MGPLAHEEGDVDEQTHAGDGADDERRGQHQRGDGHDEQGEADAGGALGRGADADDHGQHEELGHARTALRRRHARWVDGGSSTTTRSNRND